SHERCSMDRGPFEDNARVCCHGWIAVGIYFASTLRKQFRRDNSVCDQSGWKPVMFSSGQELETADRSRGIYIRANPGSDLLQPVCDRCRCRCCYSVQPATQSAVEFDDFPYIRDGYQAVVLGPETGVDLFCL